MVNTERSILDKLVVHAVGNKANEEELVLSKACLRLHDETIEGLVMRYFLSPFKNAEFYHFTHELDVADNELFAIATKIFLDDESFYLNSLSVADLLFNCSTHPKIKGGEMYMVYLRECIIDDEVVDAIGIFKSESKETYLKVAATGDNFAISSDEGININKLDKGCLIFNMDKDKGYRICTVDATNKSDDAQYWKNTFLQVKQREDSFFHTQQYMQLCKGFIDEKLKEDFEISKTDEIDLMNKSVKFFKERETFDLNEFKRDVIQQPEVIDAFRDYKNTFEQNRDVHIADEFTISHNAVKNTSKLFKSIVKLDKNFSIYIHGNKEYIQQGYDEDKRMNYYQLFYKEEK